MFTFQPASATKIIGTPETVLQVPEMAPDTWALRTRV
jgi:hypothetical protein